MRAQLDEAAGVEAEVRPTGALGGTLDQRLDLRERQQAVGAIKRGRRDSCTPQQCIYVHVQTAQPVDKDRVIACRKRCRRRLGHRCILRMSENDWTMAFAAKPPCRSDPDNSRFVRLLGEQQPANTKD